MKTPVYTCQIRAREIKAASGLIAHHGYTQPDRWHGGEGSGWRTGSCSGARHVPYEVGHEALDAWIQNLSTSWIPRTEAVIANLKANPPASYDVRRRDGYGRYRNDQPEPILAHRPEGFSTAKHPTVYSDSRSYEYAFWSQVSDNERDLKGMQQTLASAQKRRAAWVPPA